MSSTIIAILALLGLTAICSIFGVVGFGITVEQGKQTEGRLNDLEAQLSLLGSASSTVVETVIANGTCTNNNADAAPFRLIMVDRGTHVAAVMEIGPFSTTQTGNSVLIRCPFLLLGGLYNSGIFQLFSASQLANITATTPGLLVSNSNVPFSNYDLFFNSGQAQFSWTFQPPYNGAVDTWNFNSPTRFPMILVNAA